MKILFVLILNLCAFVQLDGQNHFNDFHHLAISQIEPFEIKTPFLNDSTGEFFEMVVYRYCSLIQNDSIDLEKLSNVTLIDSIGTEKIMHHLLENDKFIADKAISDCYIPRHAIILYDVRDEVVGFIEICFECIEIKSWGIANKWKFNITKEDFEGLSLVFQANALIWNQ